MSGTVIPFPSRPGARLASLIGLRPAPAVQRVRLNYRSIRLIDAPGSILWVEAIDDSTNELATSGRLKQVEAWLRANGFSYVTGTQGIYARKGKSNG